jgi:hypothetical protein
MNLQLSVLTEKRQLLRFHSEGWSMGMAIRDNWNPAIIEI